MRIIRDEPPHPRQPRQRARRLVPMNNTKLGHADRELLVRAVARVEDDAVAGAVHGLQRPLLLLDVEREHPVLVVLRVPGGFPDFVVVHVGGDDWGGVMRSLFEVSGRA